MKYQWILKIFLFDCLIENIKVCLTKRVVYTYSIHEKKCRFFILYVKYSVNQNSLFIIMIVLLWKKNKLIFIALISFRFVYLILFHFFRPLQILHSKTKIRNNIFYVLFIERVKFILLKIYFIIYLLNEINRSFVFFYFLFIFNWNIKN